MEGGWRVLVEGPFQASVLTISNTTDARAVF